jgi:hypothetical protein
VGCEARKIPAGGDVFFLDFSLYRTTQELEEFRMRTSPAHAVFTVPKRTVFGAAHDGVWLKVSLPLSRGKIFRKAPQIACPTWNDANLLLDPSVLAETI